jgi:hypothetical protein
MSGVLAAAITLSPGRWMRETDGRVGKRDFDAAGFHEAEV